MQFLETWPGKSSRTDFSDVDPVAVFFILTAARVPVSFDIYLSLTFTPPRFTGIDVVLEE